MMNHRRRQQQQQQQQHHHDDLLAENVEIRWDTNDGGETGTSSSSGSGGGVVIGGAATTTTAAGGAATTPYQSIHRRNLNRIQEDCVESRKHQVPEPQLRPGHLLLFPQQQQQQQQSNGVMNGGSDGFRSNTSRRSLASKTWDTYYKNTFIKRRSCLDWAEALLPCVKWLRPYVWRESLPKDVIAGITVGVMVVPQSMSYARLAGLPVEYGLYSALLPVYAYALFGSSRQLAVGPVALVSLILSTELIHLLDSRGIHEGDDGYVQIYTTLAVQTAFLVGIANIIMGVLRLGFITVFLSHAVVSGFTTGAAVIIGLSQVKHIFGYNVERSDRFHIMIRNIFAGIDHFNYRTFLMGMVSVAMLVVMKNLGKKYPKYKWVRAIGPLTVTAITIGVTWGFNLQEKGIPIVDTIPSGIPDVTINMWFPIEDIGSMMPTVLSITVVGFMESIAIAKQLASKHKYELDSSTELIGLGMANLAGSMFQSYPVTGSFSRSAVNNESGATSGISAIVTATMVLLVLLFLTPIFEQMPLSVLAAIVISGVLGLLDYPEAIYLWKVHRFDFFVWTLACVLTMFLGVEIGLAIAVAVSLLLVTYESAYPHTAVLGRLPGTGIYRNIKQYPDAETYDGVVMVRIDAPIYFANTQNIREKLAKYERRAEEALAAKQERQQAKEAATTISAESSHPIMDAPPPHVQYMILELSPVSHVDTSALHILSDMQKTYKDRGVQICYANPSVSVMERFIKSGLVEEVGRQHIFVTAHDAISWCLEQQDEVAMSSVVGGGGGGGGQHTQRDDDDDDLDVEHDDDLEAPSMESSQNRFHKDSNNNNNNKTESSRRNHQTYTSVVVDENNDFRDEENNDADDEEAVAFFDAHQQ